MTRPGTLADVDPLAVVRQWLLAQDDVNAVLAEHRDGGTDSLHGHQVQQSVVPPYPMVQLALLPGDTTLIWREVASVQLTVWGDDDGTIIADDLMQILRVCGLALKRMESASYGPRDAVVTHVTGGAAGPALTDPDTHQPYAVATFAITMHPPVLADAT